MRSADSRLCLIFHTVAGDQSLDWRLALLYKTEGPSVLAAGDWAR